MKLTLTVPKSDPFRFTPPWGAVVTLGPDRLPVFDYTAAYRDTDPADETLIVLTFRDVQPGQVIAYGIRNKRDPHMSAVRYGVCVPDPEDGPRLIMLNSHYLDYLAQRDGHGRAALPDEALKAAQAAAPAPLDMRCPVCFNAERFYITALAEFDTDEEGMEQVGDIEYDDSAHCRCPHCGFAAPVSCFKYVDNHHKGNGVLLAPFTTPCA